MNKKILLPLAVATLGVTACNGAKFDVKAASNAAYEAAVASAKDLDDFCIDMSISSSKFDATYVHEMLDQKVIGRNTSETYDFKLTDFKTNLYALILGLKQVDSKTGLNKLFKSHINLDETTTKGFIDYKAERFSKEKPYTANINFDKFGETKDIDIYLNRVNNYYGIYCDFTNLTQKLDSIDITLNDEYTKAENNIKKRVEAFNTLINESAKRFATIRELSGKYPVIASIVEKIQEEALGQAAIDIDAFTKHTEEQKNEVIKSIEETMTKMNKTEAGDILSMGYDSNKLHFDINLNSDKLNKIANVNCFTSGTIKCTVSADDAKRIGSFSIEVKDLKANAPYVISYDEEKNHSQKISINDVNFKIEGSIKYDIEDASMRGQVIDTLCNEMKDRLFPKAK